jgi:ribosomal protein L7Ae-like RNA K-turn-binding protein
MNKHKILNLLGLAMRAGKVVVGENSVVWGIRKQKDVLVFLAKDTGVHTSKKIMNKAKFYGMPVVRLFTSEELSHAVGKSRKVLGVVDLGFSKKLQLLVNEICITEDQ